MQRAREVFYLYAFQNVLTIALCIAIGRHSIAELTASVSIAYSAAAVVALFAPLVTASPSRRSSGRGTCDGAWAPRSSWRSSWRSSTPDRRGIAGSDYSPDLLRGRGGAGRLRARRRDTPAPRYARRAKDAS